VAEKVPAATEKVLPAMGKSSHPPRVIAPMPSRTRIGELPRLDPLTEEKAIAACQRKKTDDSQAPRVPNRASKSHDIFSELRFEPMKRRKPDQAYRTLDQLFQAANEQIIPRKVELESILTLRAEIDACSTADARSLFSEFTFAGCIGLQAILFSANSSLYCASAFALAKSFFYHQCLTLFANFPRFTGNFEITDPAVTELLNEHSAMLRDYFSISVANGVNRITSLLDLSIIHQNFNQNRKHRERKSIIVGRCETRQEFVRRQTNP
jgi:hypothetical protein